MPVGCHWALRSKPAIETRYGNGGQPESGIAGGGVAASSLWVLGSLALARPRRLRWKPCLPSAYASIGPVNVCQKHGISSAGNISLSRCPPQNHRHSVSLFVLSTCASGIFLGHFLTGQGAAAPLGCMVRPECICQRAELSGGPMHQSSRIPAGWPADYVLARSQKLSARKSSALHVAETRIGLAAL